MVEFHSGDVPVAERFDWWCESVTHNLVPAHFTTESTSDFQASSITMAMGPAYAAVLSFPELHCERPTRLIRRSDPELWEFALILDGTTQVEQNRREVVARAGDLILYDTSRPFVIHHREPTNHAIVIHVARRTLPVPEQALRDLVASPLPSKSGLGAVVSGFLRGLAEQVPTLHTTQPDHLGTAAVSLTAAFLAGLTDTTVPPPTRQQALVHEIKTFIGRNLHRDLSPAVVAAAHHISPRYLHHVFRGEKRSVAAYVREQRLARCRTELTDPLSSGLSVAEIGARWGFSDPASFNRAFKDATGLPPGEYRRAHLEA